MNIKILKRVYMWIVARVHEFFKFAVLRIRVSVSCIYEPLNMDHMKIYPLTKIWYCSKRVNDIIVNLKPRRWQITKGLGVYIKQDEGEVESPRWKKGINPVANLSLRYDRIRIWSCISETTQLGNVAFQKKKLCGQLCCQKVDEKPTVLNRASALETTGISPRPFIPYLWTCKYDDGNS